MKKSVRSIAMKIEQACKSNPLLTHLLAHGRLAAPSSTYAGRVLASRGFEHGPEVKDRLISEVRCLLNELHQSGAAVEPVEGLSHAEAIGARAGRMLAPDPQEHTLGITLRGTALGAILASAYQAMIADCVAGLMADTPVIHTTLLVPAAKADKGRLAGAYEGWKIPGRAGRDILKLLGAETKGLDADGIRDALLSMVDAGEAGNIVPMPQSNNPDAKAA